MQDVVRLPSQHAGDRGESVDTVEDVELDGARTQPRFDRAEDPVQVGFQVQYGAVGDRPAHRVREGAQESQPPGRFRGDLSRDGVPPHRPVHLGGGRQGQ